MLTVILLGTNRAVPLIMLAFDMRSVFEVNFNAVKRLLKTAFNYVPCSIPQLSYAVLPLH